MNARRRYGPVLTRWGYVAMLVLSTAVAQDHSEHQHESDAASRSGEAASPQTPAGHPDHHAAAPEQPREPVPPLTDADRAAAFPPLAGHATHDRSLSWYALLDQFETWDADDGSGLRVEGIAWAGGDINRLWLHAQGDRVDGDTTAADVELWFGHAIAPWWDFVVGIRQDVEPGPSQTFVGGGLLGLAPYRFEIEASAYVGESGQTTARLEVEYELLLTNRLILQPLLELDYFGEKDPQRGIGSGINSLEAGARLRYEFSRRFAPYIGIHHERALSDTADLRRAAGEPRSDTEVVLGLRTWF